MRSKTRIDRITSYIIAQLKVKSDKSSAARHKILDGLREEKELCVERIIKTQFDTKTMSIEQTYTLKHNLILAVGFLFNPDGLPSTHIPGTKEVEALVNIIEFQNPKWTDKEVADAVITHLESKEK